VFQRLLQFKSTEDASFELLQSVVSFCPVELLQPHLAALCRMGLERLQRSQSLQLAQSFMVFMAVLAGRTSPQVLVAALEAVGPGLALQLVQQVWAPTMAKVRGAGQRKAAAVGTTRLLCEWPALAQTPALWRVLLDAQVALLQDWVEARPEDAADQLALERMAEAGQSDEFQRLFFAGQGPPDLFPEVSNATAAFARALAGMLARSGDPAAALQGLEPKKLAPLKQWLAQAGLQL
jgi:exportin-2 (importin alpha re-exporter)